MIYSGIYGSTALGGLVQRFAIIKPSTGRPPLVLSTRAQEPVVLCSTQP
jgi:hypothetical protein